MNRLPLRTLAANPLNWGLLVALGCALAPVRLQAGQAPSTLPTPEQAKFFETRIRPVLAERCKGCHGGPEPAGKLDLTSGKGLAKGGASGPAIDREHPEKSRLLVAIQQTTALKMPPDKKLPAEVVADFQTWIKQGAPWPAATSAIGELWSLRPVRKPALPVVKLKGWARNGLDRFVLAGLEGKGLKPAPAADKRTLIRRVTYDLTGLPTTAEEVEAFLDDKSPDAYEKVVDRLLASPHYGERWARHWLDVARYADTKGYVFNEDRNYPNAYTYRDWVIRAFNEDLPYDKFVTAQLAADRLPEVRRGSDVRPLAALGFLTLGRRFLNSRPDIIDDRIDVTMRGFEGLTVACARCHDHKFDPVPSQDYYSLYAVFDSTRDSDAPISPAEVREPWNRYVAKLNELESALTALRQAQVKALRERVADPAQTNGVSADAKRILQSTGIGALPAAADLAKLEQSFAPEALNQITEQKRALSDLMKSAPAKPEMAMAIEDANPHDLYVFLRGKPEGHGPAAPRRFLSALSDSERPHWTDGSGRLELAQAIASPTNPLTARVYVNRAWQDHFGAAIVRTPSDFGHQGEKPTDPKLLDYLAATFVEEGWSVKKLNRLIVTSATYRQASDVPKATVEADPDNRLWGHMNRRRLDLEETRDALMDAAGRLNLRDIGGKSVDLWSAPFTPRRAVYGFIERQNLPGVFRTFDFATPDTTSARRFQTTVPQQALFFMNSPFCVELAKGLAGRLPAQLDDKTRVEALYRLVFQRAPDGGELALGLQYLKGPGLAGLTRLEAYAQALLMTNEFLFVD
jgi:hypothetical protein